MKDNEEMQMACVHVYEADDRTAWDGDQYYAVYHGFVESMEEYDVRLARSSDLMQWTFVRTLIPNADILEKGNDRQRQQQRCKLDLVDTRAVDEAWE
jgi:beta-xylosidase